MKTIDLCIVSTLRPELLSKTIDSFIAKVKTSRKINIVINIDCVPKRDGYYFDRCKVLKVLQRKEFEGNDLYHNTQMFEPNFAKAVKTVWENTTSDYVFHLEEDWRFIKEINLDECIERMEKENCDYMRFPKVGAWHLNDLHKVALQPSLWRGDIVRRLAKHININHDPEKQLRVGSLSKEIDEILIEVQNKGLIDYKNNCCEDIGRSWMDKNGYRKWGKGEDLTWQKKGSN